jgi:Tfp pilus assembly protein PilF
MRGARLGRGAALAAVALGVAAAGLFFLWSRRTAPPPGLEAPTLSRTLAHPIVIVGLDGADWQIADPLMEKGKLPNLARLRRSGAWGSMRSAPPLLSPLLWTTAATGKPPEEHGIVDFLVPEGGTGSKAPISSRFRRVKALWNIFGGRDLSSAFIAWWATWPAEPVRGVMVSDRVAYTLFDVKGPDREGKGLVYPASLWENLRRLVVPAASLTDGEITRLAEVTPAEIAGARAASGAGGEDASRDRLVHLMRIVAAARTYHAIALDLLALGQPDLFSVYYQGIDEVSHRFEHCAHPSLPTCDPGDAARYAGTIDAYYAYQDELLGDLLSRIDPGSYVIVISDHGFRNGGDRPREDTADIAGKPAKWHRPYGIAIVSGPGIAPGPLDSVTLLDIAPTVLRLAGLPLASDMTGHPLVELPGGSPPAKIASYEGEGAAPAIAASAPPGEDDSGRTEMLENLRSLGYIGGGDSRPASTAVSTEGETPATLTAHTNVGSIHLQKGETASAEKEFEAALALKPDYPPALMGLAGVRAQEGKNAEAQDLTKRAILATVEPEGALYLQYAGLAVKTRSTAEASSLLERLKGERPRAAEIPVGQAILAQESGDDARAEALLREALRIDPASTEAMSRLFQMKRKKGSEASLEPDIRRALSMNPTSVLHHNWLGLILERREDATGAESEFKTALGTAPDFGGTMANLGALYGRTGRLEEAVTVLSRALRIDGSDVECRVNLGAALGKLGRTDEALAVMEKGRVAGTPGPPELLNAMAVAWAQKGEARRAGDLLRESLSLSPDQPRIRAMLEELAGDR